VQGECHAFALTKLGCYVIVDIGCICHARFC